jgi:glycosyltransferase involved in cell wall biosynthesis
MTRLRVALDARRLQDNPPGGVARVIAGTIEAVGAEVDFTLVTDARRAPIPLDLPQVALRPPPRVPETVWLQWNLRRWLHGFDGIFHGTFNQVPLRPAVPSVVSIHDISFEIHHEGFSTAKRFLFQRNARYAARVAERVITGAEHARQSIIDHYAVDPAKIVTIMDAVDPAFGPQRADAAGEVLPRLGITSPYVVALDGAPRRAIEVAHGAWQRVRAGGIDVALVVIGRSSLAPEPGLVLPGRLAEADWLTVLAAADALCYPTRFEGFGMPALEAIASGTPVVCARTGPLVEILGDAAEWCGSTDVVDIAAGLDRLLRDAAHAADLRTRGLRQAARHPTWADGAELLLRTYHETAAALR